MEKSEIKGFIAKRCAKELKNGDVVNLGIGLPTMIPNYLPKDVELIIHAELGIVSAGATPKEGGPLAIVHDGDEILIDVDEGVLELHVSDEEIAERYKTLELPKKNIPNGYLRLYAKVAASADEGAIIKA